MRQLHILTVIAVLTLTAVCWSLQQGCGQSQGVEASPIADCAYTKECEWYDALQTLQQASLNVDRSLPRLAEPLIHTGNDTLRAEIWATAGHFDWSWWADEFIDASIYALREGDLAEQNMALSVLERLGPEAMPAVPALRSMLRERSANSVRIAQLLGLIGDTSAVPELLWIFQNASELAHIYDASVAPVALARLGYRPIIPRLMRNLASPVPGERSAAIEALSVFEGLPSQVAEKLRELEADPDAHVRASVVRGISASNLPTNEVSEVVARALADDSDDVRLEGIRAAGKLRLDRPTIIKQLFRHAGSSDWSTAAAAGTAIRTIAGPAVPILEGTLYEAQPPEINRAAKLLAQIPQGGYQALARASEADDVEVAHAATMCMSVAYPSAESRQAFEAVLLNHIRDRRRHIEALEAVIALRYTSEQVVHAVAHMAEDGTEPVLNRLAAIDALASISARSTVAVEALEALQQDQNSQVSDAAQDALRGPSLQKGG